MIKVSFEVFSNNGNLLPIYWPSDLDFRKRSLKSLWCFLKAFDTKLPWVKIDACGMKPPRK